ncbi:VOC family protein [Aestuariivivens sediminicola]|uniref:VOC family protein n=1 Tax=Aestuariivivens sediminicola TaxID=2913560 RepID=UPI001F5A75EA|nr:bleomycin resistance protein [Aestuariivivens sediminicola]
MEASFHMSLPCLSAKDTRDFYSHIGASFGRSTESWVDVNFFGHQITFIETDKYNFSSPNYVFEGKILPAFHFGIILDTGTWMAVYKKLEEQQLDLVTESTFLKEKVGEHRSFFVKDPNDYMLEFKTFMDPNSIFSI